MVDAQQRLKERELLKVPIVTSVDSSPERDPKEFTFQDPTEAAIRLQEVRTVEERDSTVPVLRPKPATYVNSFKEQKPKVVSNKRVT